MGVRGGEEKGKQELGSRVSAGFVLEFLQGMALERGVRLLLPLGLFLGGLDKVGWLHALVLKPQVPSLGQEPPYLPMLSFPLTLQNLSEMLLDMEVVVVCWICLFAFLHPESLDKTSLFQHRSCRMGKAEGLERGNPIIKNAQDPWSWRDDTSGDGRAILETE